MYVAVICDRNLSAELEEPKSAIEGLEGLALEYSWQELQQAPNPPGDIRGYTLNTIL